MPKTPEGELFIFLLVLRTREFRSLNQTFRRARTIDARYRVRGRRGKKNERASHTQLTVSSFLSVAEFSVVLPCAGVSGIAQFGIGLVIEKRKKKPKPLSGTPLHLRLKKECTVRGESVSRAHDQHLFARTHSSVSAVIHLPNCLICCMLLINCGETQSAGQR